MGPEMRDAGALHFIGESKQLVFHVVPREPWFGYFEALHWAMTTIEMEAPVTAPSVGDLLARDVPPPRGSTGTPASSAMR